MTNFEKYKDEILILAKNNWGFAFRMNKITACKLSGCKNCIFTGSCIVNRIKWLYEEYQEPAPKLTKAERGFCEIVKTGYIARDAVKKCLLYYSEEPEKDLNGYYWYSPYDSVELPLEPFSFITWEDEKPWKVKDLLKLEVEE